METPRPDDKRVVLLVENDPLQSMMGHDVLEEAGFEVVDSASADAALRLLSGGLEVNAVLTDVDMPGAIDGLDLAREVTARWPWISVLVTSGGVNSRAVRLPDETAFLAKPWAPDTMVRALRGLMGQPRRAPAPHALRA